MVRSNSHFGHDPGSAPDVSVGHGVWNSFPYHQHTVLKTTRQLVRSFPLSPGPASWSNGDHLRRLFIPFAEVLIMWVMIFSTYAILLSVSVAMDWIGQSGFDLNNVLERSVQEFLR